MPHNLSSSPPPRARNPLHESLSSSRKLPRLTSGYLGALVSTAGGKQGVGTGDNAGTDVTPTDRTSAQGGPDGRRGGGGGDMDDAALRALQDLMRRDSPLSHREPRDCPAVTPPAPVPALVWAHGPSTHPPLPPLPQLSAGPSTAAAAVTTRTPTSAGEDAAAAKPPTKGSLPPPAAPSSSPVLLPSWAQMDLSLIPRAKADAEASFPSSKEEEEASRYEYVRVLTTGGPTPSVEPPVTQGWLRREGEESRGGTPCPRLSGGQAPPLHTSPSFAPPATTTTPTAATAAAAAGTVSETGSTPIIMNLSGFASSPLFHWIPYEGWDDMDLCQGGSGAYRQQDALGQPYRVTSATLHNGDLSRLPDATESERTTSTPRLTHNAAAVGRLRRSVNPKLSPPQRRGSVAEHRAALSAPLGCHDPSSQPSPVTPVALRDTAVKAARGVASHPHPLPGGGGGRGAWEREGDRKRVDAALPSRPPRLLSDAPSPHYYPPAALLQRRRGDPSAHGAYPSILRPPLGATGGRLGDINIQSPDYYRTETLPPKAVPVLRDGFCSRACSVFTKVRPDGTVSVVILEDYPGFEDVASSSPPPLTSPTARAAAHDIGGDGVAVADAVELAAARDDCSVQEPFSRMRMEGSWPPPRATTTTTAAKSRLCSATAASPSLPTRGRVDLTKPGDTRAVEAPSPSGTRAAALPSLPSHTSSPSRSPAGRQRAAAIARAAPQAVGTAASVAAALSRGARTAAAFTTHAGDTASTAQELRRGGDMPPRPAVAGASTVACQGQRRCSEPLAEGNFREAVDEERGPPPTLLRPAPSRSPSVVMMEKADVSVEGQIPFSAAGIGATGAASAQPMDGCGLASNVARLMTTAAPAERAVAVPSVAGPHASRVAGSGFAAQSVLPKWCQAIADALLAPWNPQLTRHTVQRRRSFTTGTTTTTTTTTTFTSDTDSRMWSIETRGGMPIGWTAKFVTAAERALAAQRAAAAPGTVPDAAACAGAGAPEAVRAVTKGTVAIGEDGGPGLMPLWVDSADDSTPPSPFSIVPTHSDDVGNGAVECVRAAPHETAAHRADPLRQVEATRMRTSSLAAALDGSAVPSRELDQAMSSVTPLGWGSAGFLANKQRVALPRATEGEEEVRDRVPSTSISGEAPLSELHLVHLSPLTTLRTFQEYHQRLCGSAAKTTGQSPFRRCCLTTEGILCNLAAVNNDNDNDNDNTTAAQRPPALGSLVSPQSTAKVTVRADGTPTMGLWQMGTTPVRVGGAGRTGGRAALPDDGVRHVPRRPPPREDGEGGDSPAFSRLTRHPAPGVTNIVDDLDNADGEAGGGAVAGSLCADARSTMRVEGEERGTTTPVHPPSTLSLAVSPVPQSFPPSPFNGAEVRGGNGSGSGHHNGGSQAVADLLNDRQVAVLSLTDPGATELLPVQQRTMGLLHLASSQAKGSLRPTASPTAPQWSAPPQQPTTTGTREALEGVENRVPTKPRAQAPSKPSRPAFHASPNT